MARSGERRRCVVNRANAPHSQATTIVRRRQTMGCTVDLVAGLGAPVLSDDELRDRHCCRTVNDDGALTGDDGDGARPSLGVCQEIG